MRRVYTTQEDFLTENEGLATSLPYSTDLSVLKTPLTVGGFTVKNRLACQAMEGCDGTHGGSPDELTLRRYERLAKGGAGIIWFEATACCESGRANPRQLWLRKENADDFRRTVDMIKETARKSWGGEPLVILQATHSGRYSKPCGTPAPLIAYNNPIFEKDHPIDKSRILSDDAIERIGQDLVAEAKLAAACGFDGVDVKCCHRYLNSELLSAYTRSGRYGGDFDNRTRLLRETVGGAMAATPQNFIVTSRLNAYDGFPYPYGFGVKEDGDVTPDLTEPMRLVRILRDMGMKLLNITMGNPYVNPHVNRPFARGGYEAEEHPLSGVKRMLNGVATLQREVPDMPLIASAFSYLGVAAPAVAAAYVKNGDFAFAGFGRMIFAYPDFARAILENGALDPKKCCIACSKCTALMRAGGTPGCVIRDPIYTKMYAALPKESQI